MLCFQLIPHFRFWGFTFPLGSLNLLTYALATTFDSMFFKVVGTIMTASVVLLWAGVSIPTVKGWYTGSSRPYAMSAYAVRKLMVVAVFQAPCLVKIPGLLQNAAGNEKTSNAERGKAQRPT